MRRSSILLCVVFVFLVGGCYAPIQKETLPPFFSCDGWIDANGDGRVNRAEISTRATYPSYRDVCFMGEINRPFGTQVSWILFAPDGTVVEQGGTTHLRDGDVTAEKWVYYHTYAVRYLLEKGGAGLWRMEWRAGKETAGESRAKLIW